MDFDLFVLFESESDIPDDALRMTVDRMVRYGWAGLVLTRNVTSVRRLPPPPSPLALSDIARAHVERRFTLCVLHDYPAFPQFTRLNLATGDMQEIHQLTRLLSGIRFDVVSVTPLSDEVFRALCSTVDVDVISLDPTRYLPKHCWKDLKSAVNRGIAIEFLYSQFLAGDAALKTLISCCQSVVHATRGRNAKARKLFFSFGSDSPDRVRSPADVRAFGRLVGLPRVERLTSEVVKAVLAKGLARQSHAGAVRRVRAVADSVLEERLEIVVDEAP
jgi:ribonuclease P/MRP protein subunit RPP1